MGIKIFFLCVINFGSPVNLEEAFIACDWFYQVASEYRVEDLAVFHGLLESCDTLRNRTIGTYLEMYPKQVIYLRKWASHPNRWVKRGATVSLIIPARKGLFLLEIFEIAEIFIIGFR